MIYRIQAGKLFKKQYKKVLKQGKSREEIENIINYLAGCVPLAKRFKVHKLKGKFKGFFELHIEPDLLLIYEYQHEVLVLYLIQIGSHSDLFD